MIKLIKNNIRYLSKKALRLAFVISTVVSMYEIAIGQILEGSASVIKSILLLILVFVILFVENRYDDLHDATENLLRGLLTLFHSPSKSVRRP